MKLQTLRRNGGIAAAALALTVTLAACGEDEPAAESTDSGEDTSAEEEGAGADTFGDACGEIPTSGAGSFDGMVDDPVATAASNNPLLSTLVTAVDAAGLVDTLNDAEALTVFAPYNPAFEEIPADALNGLLEDPEALGGILTYHVVGEQLDPEEVVGDHETLNGGTITVEGDTSGMTVENATVLCGNIPTANATVYVIDTVMMP